MRSYTERSDVEILIYLFFLSFIAGTVHSLRSSRSISESTRYHNEYDRSDPRGHRTRNNNIDSTPESCVPGTTWKNNCNTCWCSEDGVSACTLMGCLQFDDNSNSLTNIHHRHTSFGQPASRNSIQEYSDKHSRVRRSAGVSENECIPGTSWKEDCNSCGCTETGYAVCTLKRCLHFGNDMSLLPTNNRRKRSTSDTATRSQNSVSENEKNCKHGTTWMNSCNRCRCFGGRAACTRMRCYDRETNI